MTEEISDVPAADAYLFPQAESLDLDEEARIEMADYVTTVYKDAVAERSPWMKQHLGYDDMWRGKVDDRDGPWPGASNLHIQVPYWLADSITTRQVSSIWDQTPLVGGKALEEDDEPVFRDAKNLVEYHLTHKQMRARAHASIAARTRNIHGRSLTSVFYVKHEHTFEIELPDGPPSYTTNPDGSIQLDEVTGDPIIVQSKYKEEKTRVKYEGPILVPHEWDDIVSPPDAINYQCKTDLNPLGSDFVQIRSWENLSLIWKKRNSQYPYINEDADMQERQWWIDAAPSQDRSGSGSTADNQQRVQTQDRHEGKNRQQANRRSSQARPNPEFEIITMYVPWEIKDGQFEECILFVCLEPQKLLGAFRLSAILWTNDRPLWEHHYQRVGTRIESMGVMEICKHLSAELDTIHNMRMDVGFATNMPFFFFRASAAWNPDKIVLRPLKAVPVDDVNDVRFPQLQNVTSFYHQEEQLLYSLIERVMGVTDLFLGVSPTRGAAARHATGFVGTQQEALARTSEIGHQDKEAFAWLCYLIYNMELQYGPEHRIIRLQGKEGPLGQRLTRHELWLRGEYDFQLGANEGSYASQLEQQKAQSLLQIGGQSPLTNMDMGRRWELENYVYESMGIDGIERFIGPKDAVAAGTPQSQAEENGEMDQSLHGVNRPAPVHPSDNDLEHIQQGLDHIQSEGFISMRRPNLAAHLQHMQAHQAQIQQKQQMQQAQAAAAQQPTNGNTPSPQSGPALGQERIAPQLQGVGQMGLMGTPPPANGISMPTGDLPSIG